MSNEDCTIQKDRELADSKQAYVMCANSRDKLKKENEDVKGMLGEAYAERDMALAERKATLELLREVEHAGVSPIGNHYCVLCKTFPYNGTDGHTKDCKLALKIKELEK